jgi:hypothetical protein
LVEAHSLDYQLLSVSPRIIVEASQNQDDSPTGRRPWQVPELTELPKLTDLTLISGIPGGGGIGGTVF